MKKRNPKRVKIGLYSEKGSVEAEREGGEGMKKTKETWEKNDRAI